MEEREVEGNGPQRRMRGWVDQGGENESGVQTKVLLTRIDKICAWFLSIMSTMAPLSWYNVTICLVLVQMYV